jgi:hypothetical protein
MTVERPSFMNPMSLIRNYTRVYSALAHARNEIFREQVALLTDCLELSDKQLNAFSDSHDVGDFLATEQKIMQQSAERTQERTNKVLRLWSGAWGALGDLTTEEFAPSPKAAEEPVERTKSGKPMTSAA